MGFLSRLPVVWVQRRLTSSPGRDFERTYAAVIGGELAHLSEEHRCSTESTKYDWMIRGRCDHVLDAVLPCFRGTRVAFAPATKRLVERKDWIWRPRRCIGKDG
ncbi:hypothetical protein A5739_23545 [Mycobacterium colombiense]|nr:hypothetical protein A5739_23545 [Mycobacterium colombiense]